MEACEMTGTGSFSRLMGRLRLGEDAAAREVFDRFARRLVALARRRIARPLARRVDPEDVVQSAFKSFFLRQRQGTLQPEGWDELRGLLTLITLRKCADRAEYLRAGRRDVRREVSADDGHVPTRVFALDREPRPEEAAALAEALERLSRSVHDDDRPILELTLQGYSAAEIGLRLGRAIRSVQRLREQIRRRLEGYAREGLCVGG
jgi:RNA polymerase sigma-70 factor (ECF subfamily)